MDIKDKSKVNQKIGEILNAFIGKVNSKENRDDIAYRIKCFLEEEVVDFETINLYTPSERVDQGYTDIRIDDELYPFSEIFEINVGNWHEYIFKWENGSLNDVDTIKLFQYLIDEGHAWNLQGFYGRTADELIEAGYCTLSYKETKGHYIWGNPMIPSKHQLKPNAPGTDAYVQKRKELDDDAFFEWSNCQINEEE